MMRPVRISLILSIALAGCGSKKSEPKPEAPPSAQETLEDAGDDIYHLCKVAKDFPGTPEAIQAMDKVKARHAKALTELSRLAPERKMPPEVTAALEAIVRGSTGQECKHTIGVTVKVGFDDLRNASASGTGSFKDMVAREWPWESMKLAEPIGLAVAELTGGWMEVIDMNPAPASDLTFKLEVKHNGDIALGELYTLPALAISPAVELRAPGLEMKTLKLPDIEYDAEGIVKYKVRAKTSPGSTEGADAAVFAATKKMVSALASQVWGLPEQIGLVAVGDPALTPFAGTYTVTEAREVENTCERGTAPGKGNAVTISSKARTIKIGSETAPVRVENGRLVSTERSRSYSCRTQHTEDRLELEKKGDQLVGTFHTTFANPDDCSKTCALRAELVAEPD